MSSRASVVNIATVQSGSGVSNSYIMSPVGGRYEATPIQVADGEIRGIQIDDYGRQIVIGQSAEGAAYSANPLGVGGVHRTALPTYANGEQAVIHHDVNGRVIVVDDQLLSAFNATDFATQTTLAALEGKDFATQTTLAALEAKDFATQTTLAALEGKDFATQTTLGSLLTAFNNEDFASQTTLAAINAKDFATQATLAQVLTAVSSMDNGHTVEASVYVDYSSTNLPGNASAPLELVASLPWTVKKISVFDTSGVPCELMIGAVSSEVRTLVLGPGASGEFSVPLGGGVRVSIRRLDDSVAITGGDLCINFLG